MLDTHSCQLSRNGRDSLLIVQALVYITVCTEAIYN